MDHSKNAKVIAEAQAYRSAVIRDFFAKLFGGQAHGHAVHH
ncbi:hypothetical protein [Salipiger bermudensis]|mgnify:FL=1|nr:hypothetical protein [Salipiger bermudensis]